MREIYAGQSEYVWTCFIISSFILTSLVDSQPSRITETPASDVTSSQWQTTRATLDQGQTINVIPERKTTLELQNFPVATSENNGDGNNSVNFTTNTNSMYGNEEKLNADDSNKKRYDDDISNDEKKNNTEDNDIKDLDSSGEAYVNKIINSIRSNAANNSSNRNNNNTVHSEMYNFSSQDLIHSFPLHDLKKRSSYKNDDNSNTTSYDNRNDNGDFYFYDNYNYNYVTTDIDNVSIIDGKTNNHTISVKPTTTTPSTSSALSELKEIYYSLLWYSTLVIQPIIGLLGLTGNILSGIVATRSGLNKATNIFILALALADSISLSNCINVASMLRFFPNYHPWYYQVWEYPPSLAYLCFILTILTDFVLRFSGYFISGYICTLITVERVIAVYFPLRFKSIMTPRRAWILVVSIFLFWTSCAVSIIAMFDRLQINYNPSLNIHVSYIFSKKQTNWIVSMDAYFLTPMGKFFPVIVTVAGSILIGVKVRDAGRKRKTMTSTSKKSGSGSRTTKTLMLVCGVFIVTQCVALPVFVFQYVLKEQIYWGIFQIPYYIVQSVNGSCNFIIYVVFNRKFRSELKRMFFSCSKAYKKHNGTRSTSCTTASQFQ